MLVRKESQVIDACSIPYVFGPQVDTSQILISDAALNKMGITIETDEVVSIDQEARICKTAVSLNISQIGTINGWSKNVNKLWILIFSLHVRYPPKAGMYKLSSQISNLIDV